MDEFILENDAWLQNLPIIILALIIFIIVLLIVIGFLIYIRYKNQNLKSSKRKSPFALVYADAYSSNATSSAPIKRGDYAQQQPAVQVNNISYNENLRPANPIPDRPMENNSRLLEFYFDYEDEYKI